MCKANTLIRTYIFHKGKMLIWNIMRKAKKGGYFIKQEKP